jgi:hypothetical protein
MIAYAAPDLRNWATLSDEIDGRHGQLSGPVWHPMAVDAAGR